MHSIENLFSVPLFKTNYGTISDDERQVVDRYLIDVYQNTNNYSSVESYILDKELPKLRKFIEESIVTYVENIIIGNEYDQDKLSFNITQSWLNLSAPGQSHHKHMHQNSVISGVFYFNTNLNDGITFRNPIPAQTIEIPPKSYNHYNSGAWRVIVNEGDLIMFPSHLYHQVEQVMGGKNRISLSFNVFPRGTIGSSEALTELKIN